MTWLAYPGTTGLDSIQYRITDPILDPPGTDQFYSEKSIRLPISWNCYNPQSNAAPRPLSARKEIAFGSLNNPFKLNEATIRLWAQVLTQLPSSRMLILSRSERQKSRIRQIFANAGVAPQRIGFTFPPRREEYLRLYDGIDICLDTLPYNGITTTCDALWMGVPVITLKGQTLAGRGAASVLTAAGHPEWIAQSPHEFVQIATDLAQDRARLEALHRGLRMQLAKSELMNQARFARDIEDAYRRVWREWCSEQLPL
jgi:protein O-GlcNAc transferase